MRKRVVITGIGTVNPLGNNINEFWKNIQAGECGIGPITRFDTADFPAKIAGEVKNFDPSSVIDRKEARKMDIFTLYTLVAAVEAMQGAGLKKEDLDSERTGVIIGNGIGGFDTLEASYWSLFEKGPSRVPPMTIPKLISNIAPANIAIYFNAWGPCYSVVTACSSGTDAIGAAARHIRCGEADIIIAGGTEAAIVKMGIAGFAVIQALATKYNDRPKEASRPFDKDRDGFVMSEGAGVLILEEYEHAKKRGAPILAEVAGYGMTCDANHLTAPHPEGRGAVKAIQIALADAGLKPEDIDYINAHGTSTPLNDPLETMVIKKAFGDHARKLKVSSTKSMTGHLIGAAGAVEAIVCTLAIRDQFYPPTINLNEPDPVCDLDYVPNKGVKGPIKCTMSNSLGFGGHNGIVVITKFEE